MVATSSNMHNKLCLQYTEDGVQTEQRRHTKQAVATAYVGIQTSNGDDIHIKQMRQYKH